MTIARIPSLCFIVVIALLSARNVWAETVHFTVQTSTAQTIYIIGDTPPLDMSKPLQMLSDKQRKQHKISLWFNQSPAEIKFLFTTADKQEPLKSLRTLKVSQATTYSKHTFAVPDALNDDSMPFLTPAQLQDDLKVLEQALDTLHPGLYRYQNEVQWQQKLRQTQATFGQAQPLSTVFSELAQLLTQLQCGHTYLNPLNQSAIVEQLLLGPANKLPLSFTQINKRWYITHNYSNKSLLKPGTEIKSINGQNVALLSQKLLSYMRGDGANTAQKQTELTLTNRTGLQPFDVYFPFIDKQTSSTDRAGYKLEVILANTSRPLFIDVPGLTLLEREEKIVANTPITQTWSFALTPSNVGMMTLPTFATYNMDFSWRQFYADSFAKLKAANVSELIIDIRGNTGGLDEVSEYLARYLNLGKQFDNMYYTPIIKYQNVPNNLQEHLRTWDQRFFKPEGYTREISTDFVTGYTKSTEQQTSSEPFIPTDSIYNGKIHLLVNGSNASSSFFLTQALAANERVNVVGSMTGGNQKGINGGGMFFLTLPNSQIVVDVPLFAYTPKQQPLNETPNAGITPNILDAPTIEDVILQRDGVLERLLDNLE